MTRSTGAAPLSENTVAAIQWGDGTVIDCAREVEIRGSAIAGRVPLLCQPCLGLEGLTPIALLTEQWHPADD